MHCFRRFGSLGDVGEGAGEVEGLKLRFDKDGTVAGTVKMLDLAAGMGTDRGEGRRL